MLDNRDLKITDDGDIFVKEYKAYHEDSEGNIIEDVMYEDFELVTGAECARQNILIRLRTNIKELILHPTFGNRLREVIGKRNTRDTAYQAQEILMDCICKINYISQEMVTITAIPEDTTSIIFLIDVNLSDLHEPLRILLDFGLQDGIRRFI